MKVEILSLIDTTKSLITFIAIIVSALYLISLSSKIRGFIYKQSYSFKEKSLLILLFGCLGILASEFGILILGITANVRDFIVIFSGIIGGPAVGIGAGLISGMYRMTGIYWTGFTETLGSWTAIGCGVATVGAGFLGAYLSKYKNINIRNITRKQIWLLTTLAGLYQIIHLQVSVSLISPLYGDKTFLETFVLTAKSLLIPMGLINAIGMFLFLSIMKDTIIKKETEIAEKEILELELK